MKNIVAGISVLMLAVAMAHAAQKIEARGTVEAVTLFRGQALVTRLVPVEAQAGSVAGALAWRSPA